MPFKSKSQLRTCYVRSTAFGDSRKFTTLKGRNWNCDKWLQETPDIGCLPERNDEVGAPHKELPSKKCRLQRKDEKIKGNIMIGPRGGKFFIIKQGSDQIKVYVRSTLK